MALLSVFDFFFQYARNSRKDDARIDENKANTTTERFAQESFEKLDEQKFVQPVHGALSEVLNKLEDASTDEKNEKF